MRATLDDIPIDIDRPTLAAALRAGIAHARRTGRIVVEATLDGALIDAASLAAPSDDPCPAGEIRLVSAEPRALVGAILSATATTLVSAKADQHRAAGLVQACDLDPALRLVAEVMTVWGGVRQALDQGAALLGLDLSASPPVGRGDDFSARHHLDSLTACLAELKRSIEARDWHGVADVLAYDLDREADAWRRLLSTLAESLADNA